VSSKRATASEWGVPSLTLFFFFLHDSQQFLNDHDIEIVHLGMDTHENPWNPISEEIVISALKIILDPHSYPLHVMCGLGTHRTGWCGALFFFFLLLKRMQLIPSCITALTINHRNGDRMSSKTSAVEPHFDFRRISALCWKQSPFIE
jgi:hypothetical protein